MTADYPTPSEQFTTVKPNTKKVFIRNIFSIIVYLAAIISFIIFMRTQGVIDIILSTFNISVTPSFIMYLIFSILALFVIIAIYSFFILSNVRYEFYADKLLAYTPTLLVFIESMEIPYKNIARVYVKDSNFFDQLFGSGTVLLELSGMKHKKFELKFIDQPLQLTQYIQSLVQNYMFRQQALYTEERKIENIMNKEGF